MSSKVERTRVRLAASSKNEPVARTAPTQPVRVVPFAEHVAPAGLAEDEIAIDVGLEEDRARHELDVAARRARTITPAFVGFDAGERRLDVLGDVAGVDRADAPSVARGEREARRTGRRCSEPRGMSAVLDVVARWFGSRCAPKSC